MRFRSDLLLKVRKAVIDNVLNVFNAGFCLLLFLLKKYRVYQPAIGGIFDSGIETEDNQ